MASGLGESRTDDEDGSTVRLCEHCGRQTKHWPAAKKPSGGNLLSSRKSSGAGAITSIAQERRLKCDDCGNVVVTVASDLGLSAPLSPRASARKSSWFTFGDGTSSKHLARPTSCSCNCAAVDCRCCPGRAAAPKSKSTTATNRSELDSSQQQEQDRAEGSRTPPRQEQDRAEGSRTPHRQEQDRAEGSRTPPPRLSHGPPRSADCTCTCSCASAKPAMATSHGALLGLLSGAESSSVSKRPKKQQRHSRTRSQGGWWSNLLSTFTDDQPPPSEPAAATALATSFPGIPVKIVVDAADGEQHHHHHHHHQKKNDDDDKMNNNDGDEKNCKRDESDESDVAAAEQMFTTPVPYVPRPRSPLVVVPTGVASVFAVPGVLARVASLLGQHSDVHALACVDRRCYAALLRLALLRRAARFVAPSLSLAPLGTSLATIQATLGRVAVVHILHDCRVDHRLDGRLVAHLSPLIEARTALLEQERARSSAAPRLSLRYHPVETRSSYARTVGGGGLPALYLLVTSGDDDDDDDDDDAVPWNGVQRWLASLHAAALQAADLLAQQHDVAAGTVRRAVLPLLGCYVGVVSAHNRADVFRAVVARFLALGASYVGSGPSSAT